MEEWKAVVGYEGLYEVSSIGRVRSLPRAVRGRFGASRRRGKLLSPVLHNTGYRQTTLCGGKQFSVHTLVLTAFVGPAPEGHEACHNNGVRDDNRVENLRWDSVKGNLSDRHRHGTAPTGERGSGAKLTEAQVREIKAARRYRGVIRELASKYGVAPTSISYIFLGKTWKHV